MVDPLIGPLPAEPSAWHELRHSERMKDYEERLVIEWGQGYLTFIQHATTQNKTVLEIRAHPKEPPFPRYINFSHRLGELAETYVSWQQHLKAKGVYLLTFNDGI
jgi:hypothetical protein